MIVVVSTQIVLLSITGILAHLSSITCFRCCDSHELSEKTSFEIVLAMWSTTGSVYCAMAATMVGSRHTRICTSSNSSTGHVMRSSSGKNGPPELVLLLLLLELLDEPSVSAI